MKLLRCLLMLAATVALWVAGTPYPPYQMAGLLTPREREIACLVARGLYNKEIARLLGISDQTVKNHITEAHRKTGARGRVDLAIYAYRHWRAGWETGPSDGVVLYG